MGSMYTLQHSARPIGLRRGRNDARPGPQGHRLRAIGRRPDDRVQPIRRPWLWFLLGLLCQGLGLLVSTGFGVRLPWLVSAGFGCYSVAEQGTAAAVVPCVDCYCQNPWAGAYAL
jgi:hypothetical protein